MPLHLGWPNCRIWIRLAAASLAATVSAPPTFDFDRFPAGKETRTESAHVSYSRYLRRAARRVWQEAHEYLPLYLDETLTPDTGRPLGPPIRSSFLLRPWYLCSPRNLQTHGVESKRSGGALFCRRRGVGSERLLHQLLHLRGHILRRAAYRHARQLGCASVLATSSKAYMTQVVPWPPRFGSNRNKHPTFPSTAVDVSGSVQRDGENALRLARRTAYELPSLEEVGRPELHSLKDFVITIGRRTAMA
ncbi:hypothetical protein NUW54_g10195 [Trametes sanguinea]|uniref:Uncharacterized protein n=1 Tax=Trametes sanguinea TaxID=158606 RepID=A0ACC1P0T2_9APHY|nr:hypothetical protein NUW54_g10195 [Trametes sanguinea]